MESTRYCIVVELSKYLNYIGIGLLLITPIVCFWILVWCFKKCEEKAQLKSRLMRNEGLSPKSARRAVELMKQHRWVFKRNNTDRSKIRSKVWVNVDELLQYEFCALTRWTAQLETLSASKNPEAIFAELNQFIGELKQHVDYLNLPADVQKELLQLCQIPKESLDKYNNENAVMNEV